MDDYQVRTPTDIIGQHIHLPKWDLTTTDGAANGWNYEDGTLSPGAVRERIHAINEWNIEHVCMATAIVPPTADATQRRGRCTSHVCPPARSRQQTVAVPDADGRRAPVLRPRSGAPTGSARARRCSAGSPTRWSTPTASIAAWASSSRTTTTVRRRTSRSACTPRCWRSPPARPGSTTRPARSSAPARRHDVACLADDAGRRRRPDLVAGGDSSAHRRAGRHQRRSRRRSATFREFYFEFSDFQHAYEKGHLRRRERPGSAPITQYTPPPAGFNPIAWIPNATNVLRRHGRSRTRSAWRSTRRRATRSTRSIRTSSSRRRTA